MTEDHVHGALVGMEDSLIMVESASNALGYMLDDLTQHASGEVVACIMRTLDLAAKQGRESFDILRKATVATKE